MRVFAISDLHVDYEDNANWVRNLPCSEFTKDILIVAGDISDSLKLLDWTLTTLAARFKTVLFVPGNHDLWQHRDKGISSSLDKFEHVRSVATGAGASMSAFRTDGLCILPLLSWYDYSFGQPSDELLQVWMDYRACRWPEHYSMDDVSAYFERQNLPHEAVEGEFVITFSHFLPRIDVLPAFIPVSRRMLDPILGAARIDRQIRKLNSAIHIYGHSHVNWRTRIDGVSYINNALGYPHETMITSKRLVCVHAS